MATTGVWEEDSCGYVVVFEPQLYVCVGGLITRSNEMFAGRSGATHSVHRPTRRNVPFFPGNNPLEYEQWRQPDEIEIHFRGYGIREKSGLVHGPRSGYRANGGAVALMVE